MPVEEYVQIIKKEPEGKTAYVHSFIKVLFLQSGQEWDLCECLLHGSEFSSGAIKLSWQQLFKAVQLLSPGQIMVCENHYPIRTSDNS